MVRATGALSACPSTPHPDPTPMPLDLTIGSDGTRTHLLDSRGDPLCNPLIELDWAQHLSGDAARTITVSGVCEACADTGFGHTAIRTMGYRFEFHSDTSRDRAFTTQDRPAEEEGDVADE